jgi:hypothetical protein
MKVVTFTKYLEQIRKHKNKLYTLELDGWQVPVLHGLVVLASQHPALKTGHYPSNQVITEFREWCKQVFKGWGYSPEEIEFLDKGKVPSPDGDYRIVHV